MSELIEKALADLLADLNEADEWLGAARTRRRNAAVKNATKRLASTLLDDLAAAQGEVEALRAAISWLMPPFVDSKTPTEELRTRVKVMLDDVARLDARSALTLKSEKEGAE
jgi:hypothetical protein